VNEAHGLPLSDRTIFRIASISKSFSAVAIMQLIEAGKLSLDDDASKLVGFAVRNPKFPDKVITLKMLLSHTSSINDHDALHRKQSSCSLPGYHLRYSGRLRWRRGRRS